MTTYDELFGKTALAHDTVYPARIKLLHGIIDTHGHPRDTDAEKDGRAELTIPLFAKVYRTVVGIGNTQAPLTTIALARAKSRQWQLLVPRFEPLDIRVAGLMTETTPPEEIIAGYDHPDGMEAWLTMKMFIRAASNANGKDVNDVSRIIPCIKAMTHTRFKNRKRPMALQIHMERKHNIIGDRIFFLDREKASVERDLAYILKEVPEATIIVCHVTLASTIDAIRHYRSKGYNVYGEIAPHYSIFCADDLFEDGNGGTALNTHLFCLPVPKTPADMRAIGHAMVSGEPWWLYGADGACWVNDMTRESGVKTNRRGTTIGGQTQIPEATISYVLEKFAEAGKLKHADAYLSTNACAPLGLPPRGNGLTFIREDWIVPETIERDSPHWGKISCRVAMGGQTRRYKVAES